MESLANQWDPSTGIDSFGTDTKGNSTRGDYFLESSSKVHFFAEPTALADQGNKELKPEYQSDKMSALNKSGHAMHIIPGAFQIYTKSDKIRDLVLDLGWKDPVVPQSMYIFKQKHIGGSVSSHQDSTFLYTSPKQSCLGLWLALHDATLENGCLWVRPGSHWESTRRQFKRNPEHFGDEAIKMRSNEAKGDTSAPKLIMEDIEGAKQVPWNGAVPSGGYDALFEAGFVPVECKAGDLLAFNGELDHLSLPNFSDKPRHTFQLHLVEGEKAGVTWSKGNWLQYPPDLPFMRLLDSKD
jgi:phytanoyl-CoA hydroxylase